MDKDLIDLTCLTKKELESIINLAEKIKKNPKEYTMMLKGKTLLMIFEKPSLRTRVSFETGMTQLGGHAIYYDIATSPMGGKESISDTAKTASRYADLIMARLYKHEHLIEIAKNSEIPIINALTNFSHPCQIIADLQTIKEKKGKLIDLKLAYVGDSKNNVTHSLIYGCAIVGINITIGCPKGEEFEPLPKVLEKAKKIAENTNCEITITHEVEKAVQDADIVYTDSWMSYHIAENQKEERTKIFIPYQVNKELMSKAKPDAIFMNCLPAMRGMEQTEEVIDGPQSVVFDQAENRLHAQKAIMLKLLKVEKCMY